MATLMVCRFRFRDVCRVRLRDPYQAFATGVPRGSREARLPASGSERDFPSVDGLVETS